MRLKDKVAIITGAAQGIGLACAERFLAEGAKVMMSDINEEKLKAAAATLDTASFAADAGLKADADALIARTVEVFGRVDILVNNAGITSANEFLDVKEEDFDRVIRVNLKSQFLCGQAAGRQMREQGEGGTIINMSSVNSILAIPDQVPYCVSKGGIQQLTKVMAISLAPYGIRVNAIGPGTILTELARDVVLSSEAARKKILARTPIGRCGEPEEVASCAVFLASTDSSYLTGQTIFPDGGRMALNYTVAVAD
ncbi:Glucose 1-dehydrogenase [Hartmannibacter diazotrophicus]|uniref:Glucose 1-dehydrogenase n=1 Tax=Hartmannibacter diazotrophicus TaxID=1482074 RepID=A0A2C9D9R9_9HYPH|nr:SDR family oxidoreductase [Hartmannibacter diazotrophicus]SON57074.1 Glucose 1-dehydrogenase [Hartmannibacter diazotrophicus]